MAALLVAHGRPGFYLRVLEEGEVEAGDEILRVASGPERVSVFEINALFAADGGQAAIIFSRAMGMASRNVCAGVLPKHQRP